MNIPIEYFGTAASIVVAVSLTQKNIKRLRILNFIGAAGFSVYGFLIAAWPVFGLNAFICIIDLYYLIEMKRNSNYFELLKIEHPGESEYLKKFLDFYGDDIRTFMPKYNGNIPEGSEAVFVLRDLLPASVVLYRVADGRIEIFMDYAIPAYRDMKNARFFFEKIAEIINTENAVFVTEAGNRIFNKYLAEIGFVFDEKEGVYKLS